MSLKKRRFSEHAHSFSTAAQNISEVIYIMSNKKKAKNAAPQPSPLYKTNPIPLGEETSPRAEELAIRLAKQWVDENHL